MEPDQLTEQIIYRSDGLDSLEVHRDRFEPQEVSPVSVHGRDVKIAHLPARCAFAVTAGGCLLEQDMEFVRVDAVHLDSGTHHRFIRGNRVVFEPLASCEEIKIRAWSDGAIRV